MNPKISVILPIYNVDKYLNKCIESIVNQTYKNIELILVNDGSTDNSHNICDDWKRKDERIKVIHKINGGVSSARNAGLDNATGDFISFIDPDDYVEINLYSELIDYFNDPELGMISFGFYEIKNEKITKVNIEDGYISTQEAIRHLLTWDEKVRSFPWNKIYRHSLIGNLRFSEELSTGEDTPFVFDALVKSKKYLQINIPYYYYVRRDDSLIGNCYKTRKLYTIEASRKILLNSIENKLEYIDLAKCSLLLNCYSLKKALVKSCEIKKEYIEDYIYIAGQMRSQSSLIVKEYLGLGSWIKFIMMKYLPFISKYFLK